MYLVSSRRNIDRSKAVGYQNCATNKIYGQAVYRLS